MDLWDRNAGRLLDELDRVILRRHDASCCIHCYFVLWYRPHSDPCYPSHIIIEFNDAHNVIEAKANVR